MSKQRKILLFVCFLLIDVFLLGGYFLIRDITFKNVLENEVTSLVELEFTDDRFNSTVKTKGSYGVVEKAIKSYLDNYATEVQDVFESTEDLRLNEILSYSNYLEDGPLFAKSFEYIEIYRIRVNSKIDLLIEDSNADKINNYIYEFLDDDEYIDLYHNLLIENNIINEIDDTKVLLEKKKIEINNYFDSINNVLAFLKKYKGYYVLEDREIIFVNDELTNEYNNLIGKIKRIY